MFFDEKECFMIFFDGKMWYFDGINGCLGYGMVWDVIEFDFVCFLCDFIVLDVDFWNKYGCDILV